MEYADYDNLTDQELSNMEKVTVISKVADLPMNNNSNISPCALGMSVRIDLEKRRRSTQTEAEKKAMLTRSFMDNPAKSGLSGKLTEAANILKKLETNSGSLVFREALATRMQLRTMALKNFSLQNYSDALLQSHYSLLLAKKFHMEMSRTPLSGEMAMELLILSKCYGKIGDFDKGRQHLIELRFLVENTILSYANEGKDSLNGTRSALINCDKKVFPSIVYTLAEILSTYGMWEDAELFFSKYLVLFTQVYGDDPKLSDAINSVCIHMLKGKQYLKALPLALKALEIRKKHFGDYTAEKPDVRVADAYCNVGIIYRLLNDPIDALHHFLIAIDMKMRIHNDRSHSSVQDIFLSIGCCQHTLGNYDEAAAIYREVYCTRCESFGRTHSSTIAVKQLLMDLNRDIESKVPCQEEINEQEATTEDLPPSKKKTFREMAKTTPGIEVSRIQALYREKIKHFHMPIARILPTRECVIPRDDVVKLSKAIAVQYSSRRLPIINVPRMSRGRLFLSEGQPIMECNQDAIDLFREWDLSPPEVTVDGDVVGNDPNLPVNVFLYIPIVEENNEIVKGFYDKPILVPNPGIFHAFKKGTIKQTFKTKEQIYKVVKESQNDAVVPNEPLKQDLNPNRQIPAEGNVEQVPSSSPSSLAQNLQNNNSLKTITSEKNGETENPSKEQKNHVEDIPERNVMNKDENTPDAPKIEKPEEYVVMKMGDIIKNELDASSKARNAKFLSKIGSLAKLNVKRASIPINLPKVSRKSLLPEVSPKSVNAIKKVKASQPITNASPFFSDSDCVSDASMADVSDISDIENVESLESWTGRRTLAHSPSLCAALVESAPTSLPLDLRSLQDSLPIDALTRVHAIKSLREEKSPTRCLLLDATGAPIASVPWQLDMISLTLARSCLSSELIAKHTPDSAMPAAPEAKEALDACRLLLAGEGLQKLGFNKFAASVVSIESDLISGICSTIPPSVLESIKEQKLLLEKQAISKKEKDKVAIPKEGPKVVPISKKKTPPPPPPSKKGKGAPKCPLPPPGKSPQGKQKSKVTTTVNQGEVRRFFWDPIFGDDAKDTLFSRPKVSPKIEKPEVEEVFAKAAPKSKVVAAAKPKVIQLLPDSKRAYNMNIGLSKFSKYTFKEIREAILDLNPSILTVDATESLLSLLPTPEECSIVSEYIKSGGDMAMVDRPEQFVAVMIGIPILKQRMESHQIALLFRDNFKEISKPLETIMDGCEAIMASTRLNVLANYILTIGNTLNEGDAKKGNAEGFKPTTFSKLNDFRTTTKPVKTLLQYICDIVAKEDENALEIYDELRCCEGCSKIDITAVEGCISKLKNDITKVKSAINLSEKSSKDSNDQFPSIMNEFLRDAEPKILHIEEQYKEVMLLFKETARYTGYPEKEAEKVKVSELFKHIWCFAQRVEMAKKNRLELLEKESKKNAARIKKEQAEALKKSKQRVSLLANSGVTADPKILDDEMKNIVKSL